MDAWVVLYDDDCGFCRWSADRILRLARARRLRAVPISSTEGDALLAGIAPSRRPASWHLRSPDGRVYSAGAAVAPLLRLLPAGRPLAAISERSPRLVEAIYRLIARNRGRLGLLLGTQACAVDPSRPRTERRPYEAGTIRRTGPARDNT